MGLFESVSQALNNIPGNLTSALATEFFPEALSGFLNEYLNGVSAKDFYHKLGQVEGRGLLGYLDASAKARLKGITPKDLSWFNLEWFVKEIQDEHPEIVCLILSSDYVKGQLEKQIELFKKECSA